MKILYLALLAIIVATPVYAAGSTSSTNTNSSGANSNSGANSGAAAVIEQTSTGNPSTETIRSAVPVVAPNLITGVGDCMGSTSLGATGIGFGVTAGTTWPDSSCNRRNSAALMASGLHRLDVAKEIMCNEPEVRKAYMNVGEPCAIDRTQQQQQPVAQTVSQPVGTAAATHPVTAVSAVSAADAYKNYQPIDPKSPYTTGEYYKR